MKKLLIEKMVLPLLFILLSLPSICLTQTNETHPELLEDFILNSVPFQSYDAFCPDNSPIRIFQYKSIEISNERDALMFNATNWPANDILLKALCFNLTKFFGEEWENVTKPECRLGDAFKAGETVWDNDPTKMCTRDEYMSGVSTEFVNESRWVRVKCCKTPDLPQSNDYDCFDATTDYRYTEILLNQRPNCTMNFLTSVTVSRGGNYRVGVTGRYCAYQRKGFVPDPYCAAKHRVELKRAGKYPEPHPDQYEHSFREVDALQGVVEPGVKTTQGGPFDFSCPKYQAIDQIDVEKAQDDFIFAFSCANITDGVQIGQAIRYTDYQPLPTTEDDVAMGCNFQRDEVMCGVKSYISPKESARLYSFGCCAMYNARVTDDVNEEIRGTDLAVTPPSDRMEGSSSARGQFLHRFHIETTETDNTTSLITAWSAYTYTSFSRMRKFENLATGLVNEQCYYWRSIFIGLTVVLSVLMRY